ncbi:MAG TPA: hypothetical protein DD670_00005, partial [Planctomycetaceae bacterium]|nr:hypothetical protein [Planctomycetaceae bacterium]
MSGFAGFVTHRAVEAIGWGLVHSVWQLALLALAFAGVRLALRKRSPAVRYALACIMLAIMALVPLATTWAVWSRVESSPKVAAARPAPSEPSIVASRAEPTDVMRHEPAVEATPPGVLPDSAAAAIGSPEPPPSEAAMRVEPIIAPPVAPRWLATIREWLPWLVAGWLLGVAGFSARLACGFVGTRRLRREATSPVSATVEDVLGRLAGRLGVRRAVRLVESALVEVPTLVGHLRPIILLPAAMLTGLTPRQLEAVLAHELAHVRRHDYLVNWIQTAIETVLFYHPAVWWVSREIRQERENCCDDLALSVCNDRIVYARALARVAELRSARYRSAVAETAVAATGGSLLDRIRRIVGPPAEGPTRRHAWLAGMLLLGVVLVATIGLMGVASDVAGDNGDGSENLQTELVFWHMIVDRVTAERMIGLTKETPGLLNQDFDIESDPFLTIVRKATEDQTAILPGPKMQWAEPPEWRGTHFLHGLYASGQEDIKDSTVRRDYHINCNGNFTLTRVDRALQMELDAGIDARLGFYMLGTNENIQYELRENNRPEKLSARVEPGHAHLWLRPMEQDGNADYCYVLVAQAAAVPKDLAEYVRSCNVTSRWLARGVEGALDDIRSALEWEKAAGPRADAATDSPACYTTPDGKRIEVVAVGRPARWPHRWWNLAGQPVRGIPGWQTHAADTPLLLVVKHKNESGAVNLALRAPGFSGRFESRCAPLVKAHVYGATGVSAEWDGYWISFVSFRDAQERQGFTEYLDSGGHVDLEMKHDTGEWTVIANIGEGQEIESDGGRFRLEEVNSQLKKRTGQAGFLGIGSRSDQSGLTGISANYDFDPAFQIELAAVDRDDKRTFRAPLPSVGEFEKRENRQLHETYIIDKADIDHLVILKRSVVKHVFQAIPTKPINGDAPRRGHYTTPDGKWIEVVAIGRPAKWPHRWWDMEGRPIQANPAWHKYAAEATLALVVRRDNQSDTVDFLIQTPSFNGSGSGSAGSSEFGPGESLHYLTDASADGALSKHLDEGGEVRLSVKHGTGDWTEIATIKEGQEVKADGGRFVLTKVDDRRSKRQPGLLGRMIGESEHPGLLLVDGKFDYDPAFEIQLAAVDAQGKRTMGPVTTGSGLFERDKDRRWFGHIQIDKADVDHFAILKRPVVGHVFEKIPAKPEAAPASAIVDETPESSA